MTSGSSGSEDSTHNTLRNKKDLEQAIERAVSQPQTELRKNPYLNEPTLFPVSKLLLAFVNGVLLADPWFRRYTLPRGFNGVVNYVAFRLDHKYEAKTLRMVDISIMAAVDELILIAMDHPEFPKWFDGDEISFTHALAPVTDRRQSMDLDAVKTNMRLWLTDYRRSFEEPSTASPQTSVAVPGPSSGTPKEPPAP